MRPGFSTEIEREALPENFGKARDAKNRKNRKNGVGFTMNRVKKHASLPSILGRLGEIWRRRLPEALGEGFGELIAAHDRGGFSAVERLLASVSVSKATRADAYTALARHLMNGDHAQAAQAARHACMLDLKPYRLKWLAFRLCEAGDVAGAEALLDILPPDTSFTESEARRADQVRADASRLRQREARPESGRHIENNKQLGLIRLMNEMMKETRRSQMELFFGQWRDTGCPLSAGVGGGAAGQGREHIITLTSHGDRLGTVLPRALWSIFRGAALPDRIVLFVGRDAEPPPLLDPFRARGLEVVPTDDIGPGTKILPALALFPEAVITTADDDIYYPADWYSILRKSFAQDPRAIHLHRGHTIKVDASGSLRPYIDWTATPVNGKTEQNRIFPTGVGGVLYPPGSLRLSESVIDDYLATSPRADDVFLWALARRAGTPYCVARRPQRFPISIEDSSVEDALAIDNIHGLGNDGAIARVLARWPELIEAAGIRGPSTHIAVLAEYARSLPAAGPKPPATPATPDGAAAAEPVRDGPVDVVFIADEAYVMPMAVAMTSLAANNSPGSRLRIHVVGVGPLAAGARSMLLGIGSRDVEVRIIDVPFEVVNEIGSVQERLHVSTAALAKFRLPELLPDLDRVLYLDCDVIVRADPRLLFATSLDGACLGACRDIGVLWNPRMSEIDPYFNSGVMLLDLERMRHTGATQRLIAVKRVSRNGFMDQDCLNAVFAGRVQLLNPRWNCLWISTQYRNIGVETLNDLLGTDYATLDDYRENAGVLHYTTACKPWTHAGAAGADEWFAWWRRAPDAIRQKPMRLETLPAREAASLAQKAATSRNATRNPHNPHRLG
jgi:lipopolysaccharide biosynthesis glycosyltransferase